MKLKDRITISQDGVRVKPGDSQVVSLEYRRTNLKRSYRENKDTLFDKIDYNTTIRFQSIFDTIEFKENNETVIVDRANAQDGMYTKTYITFMCRPSKIKDGLYELRIHLGNKAKLHLSHIWLEDMNGAKYLLGTDCLQNTDERIWIVAKRKTADDFKLDEFAKAVFEFNR